MDTMGRILAGIVVIVFVLGIAVLEMVSERVAEPVFPAPAPAYFADAGLEP